MIWPENKYYTVKTQIILDQKGFSFWKFFFPNLSDAKLIKLKMWQIYDFSKKRKHWVKKNVRILIFMYFLINQTLNLSNFKCDKFMISQRRGIVSSKTVQILTFHLFCSARNWSWNRGQSIRSACELPRSGWSWRTLVLLWRFSL